MRGRRELLVEDELRDAVPVAEIDEQDVAVIAAAMHPAVEHDRLPGVRLPQLAAGMRPHGHDARLRLGPAAPLRTRRAGGRAFAHPAFRASGGRSPPTASSPPERAPG